MRVRMVSNGWTTMMDAVPNGENKNKSISIRSHERGPGYAFVAGTSGSITHTNTQHTKKTVEFFLFLSRTRTYTYAACIHAHNNNNKQIDTQSGAHNKQTNKQTNKNTYTPQGVLYTVRRNVYRPAHVPEKISLPAADQRRGGAAIGDACTEKSTAKVNYHSTDGAFNFRSNEAHYRYVLRDLK